jgi:putative aldouronate transport system substrate-binding protein
MKKYRHLCIILALVMLISLTISGCKGKDKDSEQTNKDNDIVEDKKEKDEKNKEDTSKTGYPIVDEKTTLKIVSRKRHDVKNFDELKFFEDLEAKTNVHIDWEVIPNEGWEEKKGLIFASGSLPDAFFGNGIIDDIALVKYSSQGLIKPIETYIDECCPNFSKLVKENTEYLKLITAPDGHVYGIPTISEAEPDVSAPLFINTKWLKDCGKDMPTTTDEFYDVLKTFKGKDLNGNSKKDEIPFSFRYGDANTGMDSLFGAFGVLDNKSHLMVTDDDKVQFTAIQPGYKEAIKYFYKLSSEGLIDNEAFTHDLQVMTSKIKNDEHILGAFFGWSLNWAFNTTDVEYERVAPLKGPNGDQMWNCAKTSEISNKTSFCITSACKEPEVAMRWVDLMYDVDTAVQSKFGLIGYSLKENSNGKLEFAKAPEGMTINEYKHQHVPGVSGMGVFTKEMRDRFEAMTPSLEEKYELDKIYEPYLPKKVYPDVFFTLDEAEEISTLQTDILDYVDQMCAKWITQGGVDEEWDAYVKRLEGMGLDKMIKIRQDAYDRFLAAK